MSSPKAHLSSFPLLQRIAVRATSAPNAVAITVPPEDVTYGRLAADIVRLASRLALALPNTNAQIHDLGEARVALLVDKGYLAALGLPSIWAAGGLAVPVLPSLPLAEQAYIVNNADCALVVCDKNNRERADALAEQKKEGEALAVLEVDASDLAGWGEIPSGRAPVPEDTQTQARAGERKEANGEQPNGKHDVAEVKGVEGETGVMDDIAGIALAALEPIDGERRAMMLFTSGTTGRPKGAVTRHSALAAQVESIVEAWRWTENDNLLHILPLNHLHGIAVGLLPTLWAGASVEMWEKFDANKIWTRWINADGSAEDKDRHQNGNKDDDKPKSPRPITMFFSVPTGYSRLIAAYKAMSPEQQKIASAASATLRLQASGSAPLPESVKAEWESGIGGGQVLLERYGMTETGLIAGTGWENEKRVKGCVGFAFPKMEIRLWDPATSSVITERDEPGNIECRGPQVTKEYWRNPEATEKEFNDGWFRTGDVGIWSGAQGEEGMLKILGRASVDIIKSGGEKISAVEIERAILELPGIRDAAVVGLPNEEWGQIVAAVVVTDREELGVKELREELRSELAAYKLPRKVKVLESIPRNAMGKVQKKVIVEREFAAAS